MGLVGLLRSLIVSKMSEFRISNFGAAKPLNKYYAQKTRRIEGTCTRIKFRKEESIKPIFSPLKQ